jgi:hypothetical protein
MTMRMGVRRRRGKKGYKAATQWELHAEEGAEPSV